MVAEGSPEVVAKVPESYTGGFLADVLKIEPPKQAAARLNEKEPVEGIKPKKKAQ